MKQQQHHSMYHALRLIESATAFLFLCSLLVLGLFLLGNYQEFLDSSQSLLLEILQAVSLASSVVGTYYLAALIVWMVARHRALVVRLVLAIVVVGVSLTLSLGTDLVVSFLHPVSGST